MNGEGTEALIAFTLAFCAGRPAVRHRARFVPRTPCSTPPQKSAVGALGQIRAKEMAVIVPRAALVYQLVAVPGLRCTPRSVGCSVAY